jgi:hypothetical protein
MAEDNPMNRASIPTWGLLVVLGIAVLLPLEILAFVLCLFMPSPGLVTAVPLGALALAFANDRRAAWCVAAAILVVQGIANGLVLFGEIGGLRSMIDDGRFVARSFGPVAVNLSVNAAATVLGYLFCSSGERKRFFRDDLIS